mgnify:CR=1 FL=1
MSIMKTFLFFIIALITFGCGTDCVDIEDVVMSNDGLYYTKQNMELANGPICSIGGEAELKNGKRHGTWKAWYQNSNNEDKEWYESMEDAQLMRVHIYDKGKRHGTFKRWDEKGKLIKEAVFKNDKCISGDCDYSWTEWGE